MDVAVQLAPNDSYYYNNRADFYREYLQKYDKAIDDYYKAIEFSNNDEEKMRSLNNRALIYSEQNKYDLAIKEYTMAIELVPNDPLPYSNRSNVYIKQSKFNLALIDLTKAIELDKSNPDLFNARAECYKIMGDYDNALKDLDKSIELAPRFSTYYNNRADFYSDYFQKFELARKDYEKAIELADNNEYEKMRALNNRASILSETSDDEKLNEYSKAIKLTPNEPLPYSNRAKLYLNLGKYELANLDFTKAIDLDKSNPERFEARSECYIAMGNYVNALKDLDRTIQLAPNESYYYNNRADFYREFLQKYDNAFDDYDKAFELSKNNAEKMRALNNRALIYNQQNKDDLAIREYTLAMEFVVDDPLPYLNRANVYIKQSKFDLALKDLTKVIELSDYKAPFYYERANFFLNRSEFDKALIDYSLAIENATIDEKSFFYVERAIFYREYLKKEWNAYEDFKKSLELDSTNRDALIGVCDYKKSKGEIEQAIKMLDEWHSTKDISDSIRAEYFVMKGIYNSLKGSYGEAKKCFTNALEIDSKKASIFHQRGMFYEYYLNDLENSIKDYSKAIELEPENTEYYLRRSDVFFKLGNFKSQNKDISKVRKIDSKSIDLIGKEALVYASQGDFKKAIELSNEAISVSPTNYMAYLYKAKVLIKTKDFSGSEDILKKVIEMEPNDPEAFFLMGKICEQKGENFSAAYMFGITENKFSKGSYYITDDLGNTLEKSEVYYEIGVFYDKMKAHDLMCKMFSISLNLINLNQLFRLNEIKKEIEEKLKNCQN